MTLPQNVAHFSRGAGENLSLSLFIQTPAAPLLPPTAHLAPLSLLSVLPAQLVIFLVAAMSKRKLIKSNSCVGAAMAA